MNQFYATLRVMYIAGQPSDAANEEVAEIHTRVQALLDAQHTWRGAYEIEQLLAFVMTDSQVAAELLRRMAEARSLKMEYVGELQKQYEDAEAIVQDPKSAPEVVRERQKAMRYILQRLLNDLQWFYDKRIRRREAAKRLSVRVSALFLSAFLFFFSLLFVQYFFNKETVPGAPGSGDAPIQQPSR